MSKEQPKVLVAPATVLLVVGTGGFTHAAPVLELGRILAQRGHGIEFATHRGQEKWVQPAYYDFVSRVHTMGEPMTAEEEHAYYTHIQTTDPRQDYSEWFRPKLTIDAFWTSDVAHLKRIVAEVKPDVILADFFVNAARDIQHQTGVPLAMVWPQMPYGLAKVPYIPGIPGFQIDALSSEKASLTQRLSAELRPLRALPAIVDYLRFIREMRLAAGVTYSLPNLSRTPDHLALVNSFWGLETPKDLPPMIAAVGPILADEYPPLTPDLESFLHANRRVIYVSFGTHIELPPPHIARFLDAFSLLLQASLIDGIIWACPTSHHHLFPLSHLIPCPTGPIAVSDILSNHSPHWHFIPFAPQRAILSHPSTRLFVTHGGGSSVNEGLYHGTVMLCLGFFFDQPLNGLRIVEAGVGLALDKASFSAEEVVDKCRRILKDEDGTVGMNLKRMAHIARVSSRKKEFAADLVEEVMYDRMFGRALGAGPEDGSNGGRRKGGSKRSRNVRPCHLQTADARMSVWRGQNWDLMFVGCMGVAGVLGIGYRAYMWLRRR